MNGPKTTLPTDAGHRALDGGLLSPGRRRFARGAAPVLLGTLASKPVLGAQYVCTVSGHASGNVSAPQASDAVCDVGFNAVEWKTRNWPAGFTKGGLPNPSNCNYPPGQMGTRFNGFSVGSAQLEATFYVSGCGVSTTGTVAATMRQMLELSSVSGDVYHLGRVVVVSLLNAAELTSGYPVTRARIVEMFNAVKDGGTYHVEGANLNLSRHGVIEYLEKLFS